MARAVIDAAHAMGMGESETMSLATAAMELVSNMLVHAGGGLVLVRPCRGEKGSGVEVVAADAGPGIEDLSLAMRDGHSSAGGSGVGLGAVRRLADEFSLESEKGKGTKVVIRKYVGT